MNSFRKPEHQRLPRILLLDDESEIVDLCARALRGNFLVVRTSSPFEAVSFMDCGRTKIDLVLCDYNMPGMNGSEFVDRIREMGINTPVLLYTGMVLDRGDPIFRKFAGVLEKPFDSEALRKSVSNTLQSQENTTKHYRKLNGASAHIEMALQQLEGVLERKGLRGVAGHTPESAMKAFGPGDDYSIFLSWFYLNELYKKIEE